MNGQLKWYSFRWKTGVILALVCALMWYMMRGRFLHPTGNGPAGPAVSGTPFKHVWSNEKFILIGFGDSITSGYGASPGHDYFDLLAKNDDSNYREMQGRDLKRVFPNLTSIDYAEPYTTSEEHLRDQIQDLRPQPKNVKGIVVISTGGNDIIHDYGKSTPRDGAMYGCTYEEALKWKGSFSSRLRKIIEGINKSFPGGCDIFMANVYDPTDGVGDLQNAHLLLPRWRDGVPVLGLFNKVIADTAACYPNVHLVDIHAAFLGHGIHCRDRRNPNYRADDPNYWYFENLEDPNDRGYDALRRVFLRRMIEIHRPKYAFGKQASDSKH